MAKLFLKFALAKHQGFPPPSLSAAADLNDDDQAEEGEFFLLTRKELTWTGTVEFERPAKVDGIVIMLAFTATPGVKFTVEVRRDGADGKVLASVSDLVQGFPDVRFVMLKEKES